MKVTLIKRIVYDHLEPKQAEMLLARADEPPANANEAELLAYLVLDENDHMVEGTDFQQQPPLELWQYLHGGNR